MSEAGTSGPARGEPWSFRSKKGQGVQRHSRGVAYRCYLPVLTGFTSSGCAGPGPENGGDERIRTADPLVANEVLSQLSYIPKRQRVGRPILPRARQPMAAS